MTKIGLVVEGGGMKCAYSAGVLDGFIDERIDFDYAVGVSAGGANMVSFLAHQRSRAARFYTTHIKEPHYFGFKSLLEFIDVKIQDHRAGADIPDIVLIATAVQQMRERVHLQNHPVIAGVNQVIGNDDTQEIYRDIPVDELDHDACADQNHRHDQYTVNACLVFLASSCDTYDNKGNRHDKSNDIDEIQSLPVIHVLGIHTEYQMERHSRTLKRRMHEKHGYRNLRLLKVSVSRRGNDSQHRCTAEFDPFGKLMQGYEGSRRAVCHITHIFAQCRKSHDDA